MTLISCKHREGTKTSLANQGCNRCCPCQQGGNGPCFVASCKQKLSSLMRILNLGQEKTFRLLLGHKWRLVFHFTAPLNQKKPSVLQIKELFLSVRGHWITLSKTSGVGAQSANLTNWGKQSQRLRKPQQSMVLFILPPTPLRGPFKTPRVFGYCWGPQHLPLAWDPHPRSPKRIPSAS